MKSSFRNKTKKKGIFRWNLSNTQRWLQKYKHQQLLGISGSCTFLVDPAFSVYSQSKQQFILLEKMCQNLALYLIYLNSSAARSQLYFNYVIMPIPYWQCRLGKEKKPTMYTVISFLYSLVRVNTLLGKLFFKRKTKHL